MPDFRFHETDRFAEQNPDFMRGLSGEELNELDGLAEHHAGGLYVIAREVSDNLYVKAHDTWGDDGPVVVHVYDPDNPERQAVRSYATGSGALRNFLEADESWLSRSYVVGLPVVITVHPDGRVDYEVDTGDAGSVIRDEYPFPEDTEDLTDEQVEADAKAVDADHDRRHRS